MRAFDKIRQYTQVVDAVRFPLNQDTPYIIYYFSENSNFVEDYPFLNLRMIDARHIVIPITKIPRTILTPDLKNLYKNLKLIPYHSNMKIPERKNLIFDLSNYLNSIDITYSPNHYRQRAGFLILNMLQKSVTMFPNNYQKVLLYSVNVNKDLNKIIDRKIFPVVRQIKEGEMLFDHMLLNVISGNNSGYRLLIKNRAHKFPKTYLYLKNIKPVSEEAESEEAVKLATKKVMNRVNDKISAKNKKKVEKAIEDYLKKSEEETTQVTDDEVKDEDFVQIATAAILASTSGDAEKSKQIAKSIPKNKKDAALKAVEKNYADELLQPRAAVDYSDSVMVQSNNVPTMVDNRSPAHLFEKRQIDFETNLKKDFTNAFKVLETKEVPIKMEKIEIVDKPSKKGELAQSDISTVKVTMKDEFGNKHRINIDIPKIDPDSGTFRVNGQKKCLINQLVLCPLTFPKPYVGRFESSYSAFRIESKRTKKWKYLELYMGSFRLPMMLVLAYSFGFGETLKRYGIDFMMTEKKPPKESISAKIHPNAYIVFENLNTEVKKQIVDSLIKADIGKYAKFVNTKNFPSKKYFGDIIIQITGRMDATYQISSPLENIVDPVAKQVLINKQLPYELEDIMQYMAEKVVDGYKQDRNDLGNQRIRNSEVLVHIAQTQILAAYTVYKGQVLAGNAKAKYDIPQGKVFSSFINSQVVQNMEYANPLEEMSTITKVSPVGKDLGGIPDKRAVQNEGRDVHPSYFGNIDTVDTPEGNTIGINQQLTISAMITSARGMIATKDMDDSERSGALSTTTCMIPFVEANDGCRIMMAAAQAKQILPLKNPEAPVIQSGYEGILTDVLSGSFVKKSECAGKVTKVTNDEITIRCNEGKTKKIDLSPAHLHSGSGKNTLSVFNPKIEVGQTVKKGQLVAEGSCMKDGMISLGRTLSAVVMPYKGYNFEDGIVINERLVKEDKLTSLHGIERDVMVGEKDRILHLVDIGTETEKGQMLIRKTVGELEELFGTEDEEGVEAQEGSKLWKSPGGKVVDIEIFSNIGETKDPKLKQLINKTTKKYGKPPEEKFTIRGTSVKGMLIRFKIEQELKIGMGDKLCNRYGNKGIITLIEEDAKMPTLPWGETVDIILNPLGILNRMNVGGLYELYSGLISKEMANQMVKLKDKTKIIQMMSRVLASIDRSEGKRFSDTLIKNLTKLSDAKFKKMVQQISETGFVPLIIPPFRAPNYKQLLSALRIMKLKPVYPVKLPEFNAMTQYDVPFGYTYMNKLEHIGEMKIHVRSTGPKTGKTLQPTAGKSREGGQRLGEGDTYSFISYNCTTVLSELMGPLSDDLVTKNEIIADIVQKGDAEFRTPKTAPGKELLNSYFISLMLGR